MNMSITVDDGRRSIPIYDQGGEQIGAFTFHPTDIGIIDRYDRMTEQLDAILQPLEALTLESGEADIFAPRNAGAIRQARDRLYEAVNELFGAPGAAEAFFGSMHPFSPVNGEFYCNQVLQAVGAFIGRQFARETRAMSKKAKQYLK